MTGAVQEESIIKEEKLVNLAASGYKLGVFFTYFVLLSIFVLSHLFVISLEGKVFKDANIWRSCLPMFFFSCPLNSFFFLYLLEPFLSVSKAVIVLHQRGCLKRFSL